MRHFKAAHILLDLQAGESSEWQEACNICSRRYHHEHVRAVTKGNQQSGYDSA